MVENFAIATTNASPPERERGRAGPDDQRRREREFQRARRNARRVRILKIGLPLVAAVIVVGGLAVTWLARSLPENLAVDSTRIKDGRIVMEDPRMSGTDKNGRPYRLIARRAFQSLTGGGVDLEGVNAKLAIGDDTQADITAAAGHYTQGQNQLSLTDGIHVTTTSGVKIDMTKADIDIGAGSMQGTGPVKIVTPSQTIESRTIAVSQGGKQISFGGGVKMQLRSASLAKDASPSKSVPAVPTQANGQSPNSE